MYVYIYIYTYIYIERERETDIVFVIYNVPPRRKRTSKNTGKREAARRQEFGGCISTLTLFRELGLESTQIYRRSLLKRHTQTISYIVHHKACLELHIY